MRLAAPGFANRQAIRIAQRSSAPAAKSMRLVPFGQIASQTILRRWAANRGLQQTGSARVIQVPEQLIERFGRPKMFLLTRNFAIHALLYGAGKQSAAQGLNGPARFIG